MKINVAFPATGCQKLFEINDEHKVSQSEMICESVSGLQTNGIFYRFGPSMKSAWERRLTRPPSATSGKAMSSASPEATTSRDSR